MAIARRSRRTDLRRGSIDASKVFEYEKLDLTGVAPVLNGGTNLYETTHTLPGKVAEESDEDTGGGTNEPLIKISVNGIQVLLDNFELLMTKNQIKLKLPYALDTSDNLEVWYIQSI
jgi:hypothetical protein